MGYFLAGDLGGTKTILALYSTTGDGYCLVREQRFASSDYGDFSGIIADFLRGPEESPQVAVFGVAGPVVGGRVRMTNLGWLIDQEALRDRFRFAEVLVLNDLVAVAESVTILPPEDLLVVNCGTPVPQGSMAVLAPGTGLGEAYLCWSGTGYAAYPSEGGHADFAPTSEMEEALLSFLRAAHGHVSYELVCSGKGIPNIYRYLTEGAGMQVPPELAAALADVPDMTPVIVAQAQEKDGGVARLTLEIFFAILAAEAGNMALKFLATGGLYLGGGMLPKLLPVFDPKRFMARFVGKGRMAGILSSIPVRMIMAERAGLHGAALTAFRVLQK
ncbi:glucokinase [Thiovibrio frasassiensis]|uniref:Glucokinase n=1 Tax=Thiovibrio frasassiensis TaxID=2984131 RepID=A0A9X4RPG2_9BACT|nr:glucokinase [Thiovibrio frasassiensis]MDG4475222.1 glucokinase [Thiovibrio frasassiensis]